MAVRGGVGHPPLFFVSVDFKGVAAKWTLSKGVRASRQSVVGSLEKQTEEEDLTAETQRALRFGEEGDGAGMG
jgi:hypothetical protein